MELVLYFVLFAALVASIQANQVTVCEHNTADFFCPTGQRIHILSALYGREDITTCDQFLYGTQIVNWDVNCGGAGTSDTDIVTGLCEGEQYCEVGAANSVFEDPCLNTPKYLQIDFECIDVSDDQCTTACEHETAVLSCADPNKKIKIIAATYGRDDAQTCLVGNPNANWNLNCGGTGIDDPLQVAGICEGRQECFVPVVNTLFGDPCHDTPKYLQVCYECREDQQEQPPQPLIDDGDCSDLPADCIFLWRGPCSKTCGIGYMYEVYFCGNIFHPHICTRLCCLEPCHGSGSGPPAVLCRDVWPSVGP